jgi:hypothetical protein
MLIESNTFCDLLYALVRNSLVQFVLGSVLSWAIGQPSKRITTIKNYSKATVEKFPTPLWNSFRLFFSFLFARNMKINILNAFAASSSVSVVRRLFHCHRRA